MATGMRLPDHSHCRFCGDPIPFGEEFCDDDCRKGFEAREKAEKHKEYLFWGSAGIVMIVVIAIGLILA